MGICSSKVANPSGDAGIRGLQDPMTSTGSTSSAVPDYSIHILTHSLHRSLATFHNGHVYRVTPLLFFAECTLHARAQYPVQLRFQDRAVTIGCCATCWQPRITLFCGGELNIALPDPTVHANYHRLDSGNAGPIAVPHSRQIDASGTIDERKTIYEWLAKVIRATLLCNFNDSCFHQTLQLRLTDSNESQTVKLRFPDISSRMHEILRASLPKVFRTRNPAFAGAHTAGCWKSNGPVYEIARLGQRRDIPHEILFQLCDGSKVTIQEIVDGMSNVKRKLLKRHQGRPWTKEKILKCELAIVRGYMDENKLIESRFVEKAPAPELQLYREIKATQMRFAGPRPRL
ncbi:hypothetical protein OHC33_003266 [Knufia fluminis]|uniref:Uncharacterized protein n=1 Tax=Knufia fluminis TaxID=191047 RepID=A0AAN8IAI8_9EURO|nr:hypothetical protein OHC33_003266 [Knufia fluminis]